MKKVIAILILLSSIVLPQKFKVEKISGTVRALTTDSENWIELKTGNEIPPNAIVSVEKNSLVKISGREVSVTLTENSAITLSNLKKMSTEDLVLAIAMENIWNAPRNNGKNKSQSTAVYGKNEFEKNPVVSNQEFGI
ncbi:MAG: hypothetical protein LDL01_03810, partial [Ignavibacterium sp.]|nr:hypothetical protein [Ignavibacterium sp.]